MAEYTDVVKIMESDCFRQFPPKLVLEHCMSCILCDMRADGCDRDSVFDTAGAVWMCTRMRFKQYAPIFPGDELTYRVSPRAELRNSYLFEVEVFRGSEPVILYQMKFVPVDKEKRHIIRLSLLSTLWKSAPRESVPDTLGRLTPDCEFMPCGSDAVRYSDCDINGHLTSGAYLALICNALGFWESETPRYMKMMQVDFSSEVYPGTVLRFEQGSANGIRYVRGIKPDGKIAFTAACDF